MRTRIDQRLTNGFATLLFLALAAAPTLPVAARAAGAPAVDAVFVIDNSGSMKRNDPGFESRRVVLEFADALTARRPGSRVGMVVFDREARLAVPLSPVAEEGARERLAAGLRQVDFQGQLTNSGAGVERALYELRTQGRESASRAIVFLTDGLVDLGDPVEDRAARRWLYETLSKAAAEAGVRIFGIAFTESADFELIQRLALETRGEYFRALRAEGISAVLEEILARITAGSPEEAAAPTAPAAPAPVRPTVPAPVSSAAPEEGLPVLAWAALGTLALAVILGAALFRTRERPAPSVPERAALPPAAPPAASPGRAGARLLDIMRASPQGMLPFPVDRDRLSVGRDKGHDLVIPHDTISSFHATIEYHDGYYYLEDHRSTNGTRLNGTELLPNQPVQLKSGDRIDFAEYEFRFLIPEHQPSGSTVLLGGSSLPAEASLGPGTDGALGPIDVGDAELFRRCLEGHLQRIAGLGERYAEFVEASFSPERIERLASHVERLMGFGAADRKGRTETFAEGRVMYVLCVVPKSMRRAAAWFGEHYGGFTKLLGRYLDAPEFQRSTADVLCFVTYGRSNEAWVSVTIAPGDDCADPIDIMSVELLSAEERRALALHFGEAGQVL